jgi:hypothetical protein
MFQRFSAYFSALCINIQCLQQKMDMVTDHETQWYEGWKFQQKFRSETSKNDYIPNPSVFQQKFRSETSKNDYIPNPSVFQQKFRSETSKNDYTESLGFSTKFRSETFEIWLALMGFDGFCTVVRHFSGSLCIQSSHLQLSATWWLTVIIVT